MTCTVRRIELPGTPDRASTGQAVRPKIGIDEARRLALTNAKGEIVRDEKGPPSPLPIVQWHQTEPPHAVENLDSHLFHLLRIELKD